MKLASRVDAASQIAAPRRLSMHREARAIPNTSYFATRSEAALFEVDL
jgi:hypothetical protein